jgi:hypothetical protein
MEKKSGSGLLRRGGTQPVNDVYFSLQHGFDQRQVSCSNSMTDHPEEFGLKSKPLNKREDHNLPCTNHCEDDKFNELVRRRAAYY